MSAPAMDALGNGYAVVTLPGQSGRTYTVQRTECASTSMSGAGWWLARSSGARWECPRRNVARGR